MFLGKKDVSLLMDAGFSTEDLGLIPGGIRGVEIYEFPGDYFAKELIENACEQGICDLYDDINDYQEKQESLDRTRIELHENDEYPGNDDIFDNIPVGIHNQVNFLKSIKITKLSLWQSRNRNQMKWPVKNINITIPDEEKIRMSNMTPEERKELWLKYARKEWSNLWTSAVSSLYYYHYEDLIELDTKKGKYNFILIDADNIKKIGYDNLTSETKWITMMYFYKNRRR